MGSTPLPSHKHTHIPVSINVDINVKVSRTRFTKYFKAFKNEKQLKCFIICFPKSFLEFGAVVNNEQCS